ncbi:MAG: hypothetical protein MUQ32_09765, partial [Chloroflexi bacterium]|nr:hypothetical protein [Chloroflexota bacterium]
MRELRGIGKEIDEHLLDPEFVGEGDERPVVHLDGAGLATNGPEAGGVRHGGSHRLPEIGRRELQGHSTRLDLGEVEHAVDHFQQVLPVAQDRLEELPL